VAWWSKDLHCPFEEEKNTSSGESVTASPPIQYSDSRNRKRRAEDWKDSASALGGDGEVVHGDACGAGEADLEAWSGPGNRVI